MTTSIMVHSFMRDVFQAIYACSSKDQAEAKVNALFEEFCRSSQKFSNKDDLIAEATDYKSAVLDSLDQIIQQNSLFVLRG